jgi:hypothetical protein
MITRQDRKDACHLDETNHGSWCWNCFERIWQDELYEGPDCPDCCGTSRDAIPWCELNLGGR